MTSVSESVDQYDVGILAGLLSVFGILCAQFYWYTVDDAYIGLRYSKHLAEGGGLRWNLGADPVEGFTSFLGVLLGTIPHYLGLSAIDFMKFVGVIATILTIVILYVYLRYRQVGRVVASVVSAQLAISPAIAVLSVQGLETTLAVAFVLVASIAAIETVDSFRPFWVAVMDITLLLSMLTRPGLVIFAIPLQAGLFILFYRRGQRLEARRLFLYGVAILLLPGIVYMIGRVSYFGYLLPNPFYVKTGGGVLKIKGIRFLFTSVMVLLGPVLFLALYTLVTEDREPSVFCASLPVVLAISLFLSIWIFISPVQGYLWRFQAPVIAASLLVLALYLKPLTLRPFGSLVERKSVVRSVGILLLISGLLVYPMVTLPAAIIETEKRPTGDRVETGEALHTVGDDYDMFVTEAGALPYFSGWTALDRKGLNSEHIAHQGLSTSYLREYDPDLVEMLVIARPGVSDTTANFLDNSSYDLVAVIYRQPMEGQPVTGVYHVYFVDTESEGYYDISCALLTQDLRYANRTSIAYQMEESERVSDIRVSPVTERHCRTRSS